jgi:serine phosphatase RsbU (regulator of sigma subunit)
VVDARPHRLSGDRADRPSHRWLGPATAVLVVGMAVTSALAASAWLAHEENEDRITQRRTGEAAAVLTAAVPAIELPLATTTALREVVQEGDADVFRRAMAPQVLPDGQFASASLWPVGGAAPLVVVGEPLALADQRAEVIEAFMARVTSTDGLAVLDLLGEATPTLGYAYTAPGRPERTHLVYVESRLPADRTAVVQPDSAFDGLDYALYLGDAPDDEALLIASTADLPLTGRRGTATAMLGDTQLLMVMAPTEEMGGELLALLPWLVLGAGTVLTGGAAHLTARLQRRREHAERLVADNERLYAEQREASADLQRSLLPRTLATVDGVELSAAYASGELDSEVGGDWYDVVAGRRRLTVSVGDVSGRGLGAAAVMAAVRYGMRTPAANGEAPDVVLRKVSHPGAIERDGHFATVLCGTIDLEARTLSFASAGHPPPLLVAGDGVGARWLEVPLGAPIGVSHGPAYACSSEPMPMRGTLLMFTDGLYERRGESVDVGLERVRTTAIGLGDRPLQALVDELLEALTGDGAPDDTAILAVRWG